jgi:hypothetical protein
VAKQKPRSVENRDARRRQQVRFADRPMPARDTLTYDEVVSNGIEVDPATVGGLPPGYRAYRMTRPTTAPPAGLLMQQMILQGLLARQRPF